MIARHFEMEMAPPQQIELVAMMAGKGLLWSELMVRHGLRDTPYAQRVTWAFGNQVFKPQHDIILSTTKIRQNGLTKVQDSTDMFLRQLRKLREQKIIP